MSKLDLENGDFSCEATARIAPPFDSCLGHVLHFRKLEHPYRKQYDVESTARAEMEHLVTMMTRACE